MDPNFIWDVLIIGSGPAALTAAIYTTRGAHSTLILGGEKWGGQLMLTSLVENYPGFPEGVMGPDLMLNMRKQAEKHGSKFLEQNVESVDFTKTPKKVTAGGVEYQGKTVIVATGAETLWLNVSGEVPLIGRGVSSCAPCDAPFFRDKKVAVVGGGDSAMEEALVLTKYAKEVVIIHRRDEFRASAIMQQKVKENPKISILWNSEVLEVKGQDKLAALVIKNNKTNETLEIPFDGVFVAIGHSPSSQIFQGQVELDEKGFVKKKPDDKFQMATNFQGVFVAGDVHDYHYKQAITAAGFGCMAAMEAIKYLDEQSNLS